MEFQDQIGVGCLDITEEEKAAVRQVLDSERLSYGPFLRTFEQEFAALHDSRFAVIVNSGTSALEMAVACLKEVHQWQDGDEVLCPALTFIATSNVILANNLKPVFVDVDPSTYNIDPDKLEERITSRTRAIMVVHLFGQPADMPAIGAIAKKHSLKIIEDSCETMFARHSGISVGSFGDIACFSTYIAHLIVTGVGGLAVTSNPKYAEILRSLANHGRDNIYISIDDDAVDDGKLKEVISRRFKFIRRGYSYRITEMEGALGLGQLRRKDSIISARKANGAYLTEHLKRHEKHLQLPVVAPGADHVFMIYPIVIKQDSPITKEELVNFLEKHGVETRDMMPLINQDFYIKLFGDLTVQYPVTSWINDKGFYIGCHQKFTDSDRQRIVAAFDAFFAHR